MISFLSMEFTILLLWYLHSFVLISIKVLFCKSPNMKTWMEKNTNKKMISKMFSVEFKNYAIQIDHRNENE